ncbi:MAG: hypothetical protein K6T57_08510 [Thermaceae bacterium]|nr:hypothetical protein [Thermaceae bacterium]
MALVGVSVTTAILALAGWLRLIQTAPAQSWLVFALGLLLSTAAALWGVWMLIGVFRDKEESHPASSKD